MSRATEEALREAILAHARDTAAPGDDDLLGDWLVLTHWIVAASDERAGYAQYSPEGQHYHRNVGLLDSAREDRLMRQIREALED